MVRRDGCEAVVKIMSKCMRIVFNQRDLTKLKMCMHKHWSKILNGHYNVNDFVISKEVKLGKYKNPASLPAHAIVASKLVEKDPMRAPKYGERLGYLVV